MIKHSQSGTEPKARKRPAPLASELAGTLSIALCLIAFSAGILKGGWTPPSVAWEVGTPGTVSKTSQRAGDKAGKGAPEWRGLTEPAPGKTARRDFIRDLESSARAPLPANDIRTEVGFQMEQPSLKGPVIAIIIDDMGLDTGRLEAALALPDAVALSFLPYGRDVGAQAAAAKRAGHEIMLHLPMEPFGGENPGPGSLTAELPSAEFDRRLKAARAAVPGHVAINNHMGSRLTANAGAMARLMAAIAQSETIFIDSRTSPESVAYRTAKAMGLSAAERQVFLDQGFSSEASVALALARLETIAREEGHALAIGHPHVTTLAVLKPWLEAAEARGITLLPVTRYVSVIEARSRNARVAENDPSSLY